MKVGGILFFLAGRNGRRHAAGSWQAFRSALVAVEVSGMSQNNREMRRGAAANGNGCVMRTAKGTRVNHSQAVHRPECAMRRGVIESTR